jgi:transcription elongation factor GreA
MSNLVTKQGLKDLQDELNKIMEVDLPACLKSVAVSREDGDLKENAGYQTAMKVKDELYARIQEIEDILNDYELIDEDNHSIKTVQVGNTVKIEYESDKSVMEIKLVGSSESDVISGKISNESPIALAIIGKKVGQTATFKSPSGKLNIKILEIS